MSKKTVLITGSSKGLGRSIAFVFASKGHNVILHGRNEDRLGALRKEISNIGVDCRVVIGDIAEEKTIEALTRCSEEANVDILINNAGIYLNKTVDEMSINEFRKIIEVNLIAPVLLTKNIFPLFKKKSSGLIININSIAGKTSAALESAYCASKHGLRGFMGAFQFESLKYNVPIINIYFGAMSTDMSVEKGDLQKFIRTEEAAEFIYMTSQNYSSMRINEIELLRKIY